MKQRDAFIFEKQTAAVTEIVLVRKLERGCRQEDVVMEVL